MTATMVLEREEVASDDRWNVEALYPDLASWQTAFNAIAREGSSPRWPEIAAYRGKLKEGISSVKGFIETSITISRELSKLYTYAHLRHDENIASDTYKTLFSRVVSLLHDFNQELSWFEPELLSLPQSTLDTLLNSPELADYRFHLEKIARLKPHTLSPEQEELLALAGKALQTPHRTFSALNDADFKFGNALDSQGEEHLITHASYGLHMRNRDRILRKNTFTKLHGKYAEFENSLCELIDGEVQGHLFHARARRYSSCLEAALFPKNIDPAVYHALIEAVNAQLPAHHDYLDLRARLLDIHPLHLYDMNVPLTKQLDIKMPYEEAEALVIESVAPLGTEYQNLLRKGLLEERWVDRYENKNKRSGAYSSGCYDSSPYILMNYKELLRDVFTLAHEVGHSMHSLFSHRHQPYHYGDYPIFLAEVASTFNEELLLRLLLKRAQSKEEKIFLINQKIEDIRGTLFRQTMFAEFELLIHQFAEKGTPITPTLLKEEYRALNAKYFGKNVIVDTEAEIEWARIPHFYYNFYVFQYATGISAALALCERVLKGGTAEREAYLSFLKAGSSQYPIEILKQAGVDMRSPQPVCAAIQTFSNWVAELKALTKNS